ncbi:hypothetical protein EUTSA_v10009698mg [Eutrema salsugineum]|uniref:BAHD acyltransferase n=1 Tax=Eutrema salsugineum TaxID=72664 RepID=V4KTR0_EUTSA|nr:BAHD acyltransferase At5g47980 [Eutrema salsugineum]ESQ33417.1 hypothetical protein EUTSA_v10009698mg [Eutrema salsugineum]
MDLKVEEVNREVIKPASASATPHSDQIQLSLFDFSSPPAYVSAVLFYNNTNNLNSEIISQKLKTSLSNTLSRFYPLAGRIKGDSISCNNEGAVFIEASTDLTLSDFLKTLNTDSLEKIFPTTAPGESPRAWPLLSVKVSFFGSGSGVAIAVCVSHLICDAASLFTFVSDWAATTKGKSSDVKSPQFASTTIYPPPHISFQVPNMDALTHFSEKCVTKRFVFESSKIPELKRVATSETVAFPSRVEAITALIWRCATKASPRSDWSSMMNQAIDLRLRIPSDVLSQDAIGNLLTFFFLKKEPGSDMEIDKIVAEFRKAKEGVNEMIKESVTTSTLTQNLMKVTVDFISELKTKTNLYGVTSWCNRRFYEVDFGMGGPVWVGTRAAVPDSQLYVLLMDAKDGESVEALVGLPEQDMAVFERDQELLAYATLNPPILI